MSFLSFDDRFLSFFFGSSSESDDDDEDVDEKERLFSWSLFRFLRFLEGFGASTSIEVAGALATSVFLRAFFFSSEDDSLSLLEESEEEERERLSNSPFLVRRRRLALAGAGAGESSAFLALLAGGLDGDVKGVC